MKKKYFILASILILSFTFCKKKTTPSVVATSSYVNGTLRDLTGFDGCGWLIELDTVDQYGSDMLEPINLGSFNLNLVSGQKVMFNYTPRRDRYSPCMRGTIVELTTIRYK